MTKTLPRYLRSDRRRRDGRELLAPLPPILLEHLADSTPLVEHRRAAERLVELGTASRHHLQAPLNSTSLRRRCLIDPEGSPS